MKTIGIIGAGLVGTSWAIVFARAGLHVRVFDSSPESGNAIRSHLSASLTQLSEAGLLREAASEISSRIHLVEDIAGAVRGSDYIQESVREDVRIKEEVAKQIEAHLESHAFVGSSTSGFPSSAFTAELKRRESFLVVHPVNPPHLIPVVEIVPAPWTSAETVSAADSLMRQVGQRPVLVRKEIDGFVLNRLQGALLEEAWRLYSAGYASVDDIDATISQGLGMRWAFMGPFETIDLNAKGGISDYAKHLAAMYQRIADTRPVVEAWNLQAVENASIERRQLVAENDLTSRREWRDAMLLKLIKALRSEQP